MASDIHDEAPIAGVLGDRIRDARHTQNMTQGELAGNDYSVSYISAIERNKIRPSLRALAWLASRLNVNLSDLLASDSPLLSDLLASITIAEDDVQFALTQAQMSISTHRFEEARERLLAVRDSAKIPSQRIQLNLLLGEASVALHMGSAAKDVLEQNLLLTRDIDPTSQEHSRNVLGLAYNLLNMQMMAAECHRQCLTAIESHILRDPSFELSVLNNLGTDYLLLGQNDEAVKVFKRASELGQKMLSPQSLAELYWKISDDYRHDGMVPQAQRYADMATEHLREAANRQTFARVQSNLGLAYAEQHDNENAEATLQRARDLAAGDPQARSLVLASLARVQLARGANDAALTSATESLASAELTSDQESLGRAHIVLGEALSSVDKGTEADDHFAQGLKSFEASGSQAELSRAYERYADLLEQRGEVKKALEYLRKARSSTPPIMR